MISDKTLNKFANKYAQEAQEVPEAPLPAITDPYLKSNPELQRLRNKAYTLMRAPSSASDSIDPFIKEFFKQMEFMDTNNVSADPASRLSIYQESLKQINNCIKNMNVVNQSLAAAAKTVNEMINYVSTHKK